MKDVSERITESLQELGLSLYEARLYLGLLTRGPQNGNELSRTSGVPSSKVYAMLERLAAAGIVAHTRRGNTVEYVSVPPQDVLHKLRERYTKPLDYLEATLPTIVSSDPEPDVLQVAGRDAIIDHARVIVRNAKSEIYLSIWGENLDLLRADLAAADARGVRIFGMLYGEGDLDVGWWQHHSYRETVASRIGGRMLTLVADGTEALIAHMPERGDPSAVRTQNPVLCLVAEEYLIHDLTLQKAKTMTGYEEWDQWLRADEQVRELTVGRTGHLVPIEPEVETGV
ncbi:MAG: HTH-type transcriptional regulator, sugar sensing transcriptional regulator [Gaiellales bacterium]|jgi:sugar-specific transcriptional regulator TrmB|nr:HTH-type transcriptional regulator, sugar sensing transcriptional regulator [Gaiellales bacterium]